MAKEVQKTTALLDIEGAVNLLKDTIKILKRHNFAKLQQNAQYNDLETNFKSTTKY